MVAMCVRVCMFTIKEYIKKYLSYQQHPDCLNIYRLYTGVMKIVL